MCVDRGFATPHHQQKQNVLLQTRKTSLEGLPHPPTMNALLVSIGTWPDFFPSNAAGGSVCLSVSLCVCVRVSVSWSPILQPLCWDLGELTCWSPFQSRAAQCSRNSLLFLTVTHSLVQTQPERVLCSCFLAALETHVWQMPSEQCDDSGNCAKTASRCHRHT